MTERRRHMCNACGVWGEWGPSWYWFGSPADVEDGKRIIKVCSDKCKAEAEKKLAKTGGEIPID